jgi:hypothetical protein
LENYLQNYQFRIESKLVENMEVTKMNVESHGNQTIQQEQMFNLIKKTYENGNMEKMTISELMEQLKIDLQGVLAK